MNKTTNSDDTPGGRDVSGEARTSAGTGSTGGRGGRGTGSATGAGGSGRSGGAGGGGGTGSTGGAGGAGGARRGGGEGHPGEGTGPSRSARPAADIYETADAVEMMIDIPGVSQEDLSLRLDGSELLLEGKVRQRPGEPSGESRLPDSYRRLFALSDAIDRGGISARLRDGVLHLHLEKSEQVKARSIPIEQE